MCFLRFANKNGGFKPKPTANNEWSKRRTTNTTEIREKTKKKREISSSLIWPSLQSQSII